MTVRYVVYRDPVQAINDDGREFDDPVDAARYRIECGAAAAHMPLRVRVNGEVTFGTAEQIAPYMDAIDSLR